MAEPHVLLCVISLPKVSWSALTPGAATARAGGAPRLVEEMDLDLGDHAWPVKSRIDGHAAYGGKHGT
jgi:hypothetical protein